MNKTKFLGARIEPKVFGMVDDIAEEKNIDRTSAIRMLIYAGWKELKLEKALRLYKEGLVSIDNAAKIANLTISEMINEIAAHGIKSDETVEEYRRGLNILENK